jgi:hypothetical protein
LTTLIDNAELSDSDLEQFWARALTSTIINYLRWTQVEPENLFVDSEQGPRIFSEDPTDHLTEDE